MKTSTMPIGKPMSGTAMITGHGIDACALEAVSHMTMMAAMQRKAAMKMPPIMNARARSGTIERQRGFCGILRVPG
ncbi:hypothetical protein Q9Q99_10325 [Curtobacterium flaccumfaciens]|nr:hypothetical protein Q9Q99_10325 [Curtobacterium flaccumfaciens]